MMASVLFLIITILLCLIRAGIDILAFFIVVRMIVQTRRAPRWIMAFDAAGCELVNGSIRILDRGLLFLTGAHWRENAKLVLALLVLWILRFSLG